MFDFICVIIILIVYALIVRIILGIFPKEPDDFSEWDKAEERKCELSDGLTMLFVPMTAEDWEPETSTAEWMGDTTKPSLRGLYTIRVSNDDEEDDEYSMYWNGEFWCSPTQRNFVTYFQKLEWLNERIGT